jgi:hypothetical protein
MVGYHPPVPIYQTNASNTIVMNDTILPSHPVSKRTQETKSDICAEVDKIAFFCGMILRLNCKLNIIDDLKGQE